MNLAELHEMTAKERAAEKRIQIRVCVASGCLSSNSQGVLAELKETVKNAGLEGSVEVRGVGCMRLCSQGPLVEIADSGSVYVKVRREHVGAILEALQGRADVLEKVSTDIPFFAKQLPIVLENSGIVDPERIESYIARGGYEALYHVLNEMRPADVVEAITRSGLRGRGGAGFPTGIKWATVAKTNAERKFVVCNADEGDPGAYMDRSVLESDPHRVLEGMAIAAYAVGAEQGYIYVRGEYPLAISRLQTAIRQARRLGLISTRVFDTPFNFRVDIRVGAGAFVCGEETALMASIEGRRGTPRPRPPFPAESGLWGFPTLINNVETFANIPPIIRNGAEWFASIGTERSKGTKVFALAGKVCHTGLIEVPMGTTLREIVEEMGGGVLGGKRVKAVQTGGPSGGCVPESAFDTPVDYESLVHIGSIMGSGGMIVMDEDTNMVDIARYFMEFCMDESCGKCIPCRAGTVQMYRLLSKILAGEASVADVDKLATLCEVVRQTSLCGLGQTAPNPVLSTLRHFRADYDALLKRAE